jgi:hypothetical protein
MAVGEYMIGFVGLNWPDLDQIRFSLASRFLAMTTSLDPAKS